MIVHLSYHEQAASPIEKTTVKVDNEHVTIEEPVADLIDKDAVRVSENNGDFGVMIIGESVRSVEALNKRLNEELKGIDPSKVKKLEFYSVNNLHSLDGIMSFPAVDYLIVHYGGINSVSWLRNFPNVKTVWLIGNKVASFEGFPELPHLEVLNIERIPAKSLKGIPALPALTQLVAGGDSPLESIEDIPQLPKLKEFWMSGCKLKSLKGIENCPNVESLDIDDTNVSEADALEYSKKHPNCEIRFSNRSIKNGEYIR